MKLFRVTLSTEDGNSTDDKNTLHEAEDFARAVIADFEEANPGLTFHPHDSARHLRLYKTRKGHVVSIDEVTYGF